MELTPEQLRDVHDMASHTIAESELPRVVRERDALLAACKLAVRSWGDYRPRPNSNAAKAIRMMEAAIALCEQPQPEPQPCPTPPTDQKPKS